MSLDVAIAAMQDLAMAQTRLKTLQKDKTTVQKRLSDINIQIDQARQTLDDLKAAAKKAVNEAL